MTRATVSPVGGGESHPASTGTECVADILEQELEPTIQDWIELVEKEPDLIRIPLNFEERTGHLPTLLHDVIARLRLDKGSRAPVSVAAGHHGKLKFSKLLPDVVTIADEVDAQLKQQILCFLPVEATEKKH